MVIANKIQKRIGILFCIFSALVLLTNVGREVYLNGFSNLLSFDYLTFYIYPLIFGLSIKYHNNILKFLQILCIGMEGILTLISGPEDYFFGLLFVTISILLTYSYGWFNTSRALKISSLSSFLVLIFMKFPLSGRVCPILSSVMWVVGIATMLFVLWIIFKDYINEYKKQANFTEQKLRKSLDELQNKIDVYSDIGHDSISTSKELLEIVKKHLKENKDQAYDRE